MKKIVTFGEIMLRLKSPAHERFFQSPLLEATFGGGGRQTLRCRCQLLEKKLLLLQCFPIIRSAMRRYRNKLYPSC